MGETPPVQSPVLNWRDHSPTGSSNHQPDLILSQAMRDRFVLPESAVLTSDWERALECGM